MTRYAIIVDLNRCTGCMTCVLACKEENDTGPGVWWNKILEIESEDLDNINYVRYACMHCDSPPCVDACPEGAISRRPDGIVLIDQEKCKAHGECAGACPYGVIEINPGQGYFSEKKKTIEKTAPDFQRHLPGKASKCTLCVHRIDRGKDPACVAGCPSKALIFGDLDDPNSKIREKLRKAGPLLGQKKANPKVFYIISGSLFYLIENSVKRDLRAGASLDRPLYLLNRYNCK
ncbi:MAG: 4Fe-4S dicluster domain-containing protein [Desulfobacteraceae bacterium]|nr:4Fe-4S dicluster domain-containing protein [Desulfobacteraceae bacterium]